MTSRRKYKKPPKPESVVFTKKTPDLAEIFAGCDKHLYTLEYGAELAGMTRSTFCRYLKHWRETGQVKQHGNKGRSPANKIDDATRQKITDLIITKYWDFQATLLHEYLVRDEGIFVSDEWLRKLLIELRPEQTSTERRSSAHMLRRRRSSRGELVQIDGTPHRWFPNDDNKYCLVGFIDDATGEVMSAYFSETETTEAYLVALRQYLFSHGLPAALYSDRHSIFVKLDENGRRVKSAKVQPTQFGRVCECLGIELICAYSPEAKGRIERAWRTLQTRWPKEFRVLNIRNMAEANERMPELLGRYNKTFSRTPADEKDSHVPLTAEQVEEMDAIFATWHTRMISRNLTVSNGKTILQIKYVPSELRPALRKSKVELVEYSDGRVELLWHDRRKWETECRSDGNRRRPKEYLRLNYEAHDRYDMQPRIKEAPKETSESDEGETAKTIDSTMNALAEKREAEGDPREGVPTITVVDAKGTVEKIDCSS